LKKISKTLERKMMNLLQGITSFLIEYYWIMSRPENDCKDELKSPPIRNRNALQWWWTRA